MDAEKDPGRESLVYHPSKVSWAVAEIVARPPRVLFRGVFYIILAVLLVFLAFAYVAKVSVTASGRGMIRSTLNTIPVRSPLTSEIKAIFVKQGQSVARGQSLVEMSDVLEAGEVQAVRARLRSIESLLRGNDRQKATYQSARSVAESRFQLGRKALVNESSGLDKATQDYAQALYNYHYEVPRLISGDQKEKQLVERRLSTIRQKNLQQTLQQDYQDLMTQKARLESSINNQRVQARSRMTEAKSTLRLRLKTFKDNFESFAKEQKVNAPVSGIVSQVLVSGAGEFVQAGTELFQIIPNGGELVAEIAVENRDIAKIQPGLPIKYKLDAFPYQEYGFVEGVVTYVPKDITQQKNEAGAQQAVYLVRGNLNAPYIQTGAQRQNLRLGMSLSADIQTKKRTLLDLIVFEVLKFKDDLF